MLVPRLTHGDVDRLGHAGDRGISEREIAPKAGLLPTDKAARAHCRAVSGEMHSGFYNLRSALPMNLKARHEKFKIFSGARPDVERIKAIWTRMPRRPMAGRICSATAERRRRDVRAGLHALPHLCGRARAGARRLLRSIFAWPLMQEWTEGAIAEPDEIMELEVEF